MSDVEEKITVENVNVPGITTRVSKAMYDAMQQAMRKVLPTKSADLTQAEIRELVVPHLPEDLFPDGAKSRMVVKNRAAGSRGKGKPGSRGKQTAALASDYFMKTTYRSKVWNLVHFQSA